MTPLTTLSFVLLAAHAMRVEGPGAALFWLLALLLPVDATLQAGKSVQLIDSETGQFLTDAVTITPLQAVSSAELEGIVVGQNQGLYQVAVNLHDFPLSDSLMQHIHVRIQMGTTPLYSLLGLSQAMTGTP